MKIIKKEYVKVLEWAFKIAYLFLGLSTFNTFLYDSQVQPTLVRICLVLGALTLVGRLFFFRNYWKMPHWILLALFCLSFLLSMVVNYRYGAFTADFKWLIWTGLLFFLLYVCDTSRDAEAYKKEFTVLAHILIIYSVIAAAVSIYLMLRLYHATWYTAGGELMIAGFQWGRLWGVYTDPNYGSTFSVAAILLCVYFFKKRKKWGKIPYGIAIFVDYLYITFSDSRTAEVAMAASAAFWIITSLLWKKKSWKRAFAGILAAVVFAGAFVGATSVIKSEYNAEIQTKIQAQTAAQRQTNQQTKKKTQKQTTPSQKVGRQADLEEDVSNGRLALWESSVEIWSASPIWGTGYNSFLPFVKEHVPQSYVLNNSQGEYVSLHNEYINILVYQGVLGFGLFAAFGVLTLIKWCRNLHLVRQEDRDYICVLTGCALVVLVTMVFLMEGLYTNSPGSFILWAFLGYLMHYFARKERAEAEK